MWLTWLKDNLMWLKGGYVYFVMNNFLLPFQIYLKKFKKGDKKCHFMKNPASLTTLTTLTTRKFIYLYIHKLKKKKKNSLYIFMWLTWLKF